MIMIKMKICLNLLLGRVPPILNPMDNQATSTTFGSSQLAYIDCVLSDHGAYQEHTSGPGYYIHGAKGT